MISRNTAKIMITIKGNIVPNNIAIPRRINTKPKYIGFLVILKIPVVISTFASNNGFTVVSFFLNDESAAKFKIMPISIGIIPKSVKG